MRANLFPDTPRRRLSDTIVTAFNQACSSQNSVAAHHLILALEAVFSQQKVTHPTDRRAFVDALGEMRRSLLLASVPTAETSVIPAQAAMHER